MILISGLSSQIGIQIFKNINKSKIINLGRNRFKNTQYIFMDIDNCKFNKKKLIKFSNQIKIFINIGYSRNAKNKKFNYKIIKKILPILNKKTVMINISTLSALTSSLYGIEKLKIEKEFEKYDGINIRCGLIYNKILDGFFKKIIDIGEIFRILLLPNFFKKEIFYLTKLDNLIKTILKKIKKKKYKKNYIILNKKKYNFPNLINKFSTKKIYYIFIANFLFEFILKIFSNLKVLDIDEDSFVSIKQINSDKIISPNFKLILD